jgi:hypothetical protein
VTRGQPPRPEAQVFVIDDSSTLKRMMLKQADVADLIRWIGLFCSQSAN